MTVGRPSAWNRFFSSVAGLLCCLCLTTSACNLLPDSFENQAEETSDQSSNLEDSLVSDFEDPCPEILGGKIEIGPTTDLDQFLCLREVNGSLILDGILSEDLHFFHQLERVNGVFSLSQAPNLESLAGLENLHEVVIELSLSNNPRLVDISALASLRRWRSFYLHNNASLENLRSIQGDFSGSPPYTGPRKLILSSLPKIQNLDGFSHISNFAGYLHIEDCGELRDLQGLQSMMEGPHFDPFPTEIKLLSLPKLESLQGLESMTSIDVFSVKHCPNLRSMEGLNELREARQINIEVNESLETLAGLESLEQVHDALRIGQCTAYHELENPKLASIDALIQLQKVRYLQISNTLIEDLNAFESLTEMDDVFFRHNLRLPIENIYEFLKSVDQFHPNSANDHICGSFEQEKSCGSCPFGCNKPTLQKDLIR